jgi:hypothetical protein
MWPTTFRPQPKTRIKPVRVHDYNPDLRVTISRVVSYRAECACGARMPYRAQFSMANRDARMHECPSDA